MASTPGHAVGVRRENPVSASVTKSSSRSSIAADSNRRVTSMGMRLPVPVMTDAGVEVVATYMRWVYFRRPAAAGPFELFSDLESRISHYQHVLALYALLTGILAASGNIWMNFLVDLVETKMGAGFGLPIFVLYILLIASLFTSMLRVFRRVRRLKEQAQLTE